MNLSKQETALSDCMVIEFKRIFDNRGWFQRSFGKEELNQLEIDFSPVQANFAHTAKAGTVRGLHLQKSPHGEDKLFHCVKGSVFDVAVDLREKSPTFGKWFGITLSAEIPRALFIPKGFAHGYMSLEDDVLVSYFVSGKYNPESEEAISPIHASLEINWPRKISLISEKDLGAASTGKLPSSGY